MFNYINPVITVISLRLAWVWVRMLKIALHYLIYVACMPKFVRETLLRNVFKDNSPSLSKIFVDKQNLQMELKLTGNCCKPDWLGQLNMSVLMLNRNICCHTS